MLVCTKTSCFRFFLICGDILNNETLKAQKATFCHFFSNKKYKVNTATISRVLNFPLVFQIFAKNCPCSNCSPKSLPCWFAYKCNRVKSPKFLLLTIAKAIRYVGAIKKANTFLSGLTVNQIKLTMSSNEFQSTIIFC